MKKTFLSILFCFLALTVSVQAQGGLRASRLSESADRLVTQSSDLSRRIYDDFRTRRNSTRSDLDTVFLAQQLESSARLFQQMVGDRRRNSELRDAVQILSDLSRRAPSFGSSSYLWRDVQSTIDNMQREIGVGGGNGGGRDDDGGYDRPQRPVSGRVTWRGTVDDEVQLTIRGRDLETRTISGSEFRNESFNFTSALPNRNVTVEVNRRKGRGRVTVIQQPTRNNDFTAVIQILDKDSGNREYELDISWY